MASAYLNKKIGKTNIKTKYLLRLNIEEEVKSEIINTTSTATKYKVNHVINYQLILSAKSCLILERSQVTSSNFDSKSSGYSFGSDISKNVTIEKNLQTNIQQFLNYVEKKENEIDCINEN